MMSNIFNIGSNNNEKKSEDVQLHEQINSELEEYNRIELESIDKVSTELKELVEPVLCVNVESEEELSFLMGLLEEEDSDKEDLTIKVVIPIEDILRPIGNIVMSYDNLIKVKVYNPRIKISLVANNINKLLTDEDIICL